MRGIFSFFGRPGSWGDFLTICFALKDVLWFNKQRKSSLPDDQKHALLNGLSVVNEVVVGEELDEGIDFRERTPLPQRGAPKEFPIISKDPGRSRHVSELMLSIGAETAVGCPLPSPMGTYSGISLSLVFLRG